MMSLTCLIACCTLLKSSNGIYLNNIRYLTYMQSAKCRILEQHKECRQRLGLTKMTKEDFIYEMECK